MHLCNSLGCITCHLIYSLYQRYDLHGSEGYHLRTSYQHYRTNLLSEMAGSTTVDSDVCFSTRDISNQQDILNLKVLFSKVGNTDIFVRSCLKQRQWKCMLTDRFSNGPCAALVLCSKEEQNVSFQANDQSKDIRH